MDVLQHMSRNYHGCSDIGAYHVCALTMFALSQNFTVVVLEHKPVHLWQLLSETTLYTVR